MWLTKRHPATVLNRPLSVLERRSGTRGEMMPLKHPSLNPSQNTVLTTPWKVAESQLQRLTHGSFWFRMVDLGFDLTILYLSQAARSA
jgi:hypothetical protein